MKELESYVYEELKGRPTDEPFTDTAILNVLRKKYTQIDTILSQAVVLKI